MNYLKGFIMVWTCTIAFDVSVTADEQDDTSLLGSKQKFCGELLDKTIERFCVNRRHISHSSKKHHRNQNGTRVGKFKIRGQKHRFLQNHCCVEECSINFIKSNCPGTHKGFGKKNRTSTDHHRMIDNLDACPPFGKEARFEVETIQTMSPMYGCAYMGNKTQKNNASLFHLWLERPVETAVHEHCNNVENMDHFMFGCLSKNIPINDYEKGLGWHYISLLEHSAHDHLRTKTDTRSYRCAQYHSYIDFNPTVKSAGLQHNGIDVNGGRLGADLSLYDVEDVDDEMMRIIRLVISEPIIADKFNENQCYRLSELFGRNELPFLPKGSRYWPDGSMYLYLLGRKPKSFMTNSKSPVNSRPTTTTRRPTTTTTTTTRRPTTTTTTTTRRPTTTTTTTTEHYYVDDFFFVLPSS